MWIMILCCYRICGGGKLCGTPRPSAQDFRGYEKRRQLEEDARLSFSGRAARTSSSPQRFRSPEYLGSPGISNSRSAQRDHPTTVPGGLWVRRLPEDTTAEMLRSSFECYSKVLKAYLLPTREGNVNSSAHVVLEDQRTAEDMISGKYGFLAVPGNRHLIRSADLKPLDARYERCVASCARLFV